MSEKWENIAKQAEAGNFMVYQDQNKDMEVILIHNGQEDIGMVCLDTETGEMVMYAVEMGDSSKKWYYMARIIKATWEMVENG
jgi:hypothetical protein